MRAKLYFGALVAVVIFQVFMFMREVILLNNGREVFFRVSISKSRSLIQGDFISLNYDIVNGMNHDMDVDFAELPHRGKLILDIDNDGVATYKGLYKVNAEDMNSDNSVAGNSGKEIVINYVRRQQKTWNNHVYIAPQSYMLQEGWADKYNSALYAEIRVDREGNCHLAGLRDASFHKL